MNIFSQHLFELPCSPRGCRTLTENGSKNNVWVQPFGIWNEQSKRGQLRGVNSDSAGIVAGYDRCFPHCYVGAGGIPIRISDGRVLLERGVSTKFMGGYTAAISMTTSPPISPQWQEGIFMM
jgi:hypothetical protein